MQLDKKFAHFKEYFLFFTYLRAFGSAVEIGNEKFKKLVPKT